jgi:hypothetical protein
MPTDDETILSNQTIKSQSEDKYTMTITYDNTTAALNYYMMLANETNTFTSIIEVEKTSAAEVSAICKRATTLHTETCNNGSSSNNYYCYADGYAIGSTVTYGSLGTEGTLTSGDAFDCDVNGDGKYDPETERFYYVSDYYNTSTKTFNNNYAVLIYYSNVSSGTPSNSITYAYDESASNNNGPVTAIKQLPTTKQWSNVNLLNATRAIITETGTTSTLAGSLPTNFSYVGYAARLITYEEVNTGCYDGTTAITTTKGLSSKCQYLYENTRYISSTYKDYWLETPNSSYSNYVWRVDAMLNLVGFGNAGVFGVRPAIEVLKSDIEY